jgi:membrane protein YdbS with pleckstrin-like domain
MDERQIKHYVRRCSRNAVWCWLWSVATIVFLVLSIVAYEHDWMVGSEKSRIYGVFGVAALASFLFAFLSFSFWRESRRRLDEYLELICR